MSADTDNDFLINEARKRMDELRKRTIRYNLLMALFFCLVILGLFGSVFYYNKMTTLNLNLEILTDSLKKANKSLDRATNAAFRERSRADSFLILLKNGTKLDTTTKLEIQKYVATVTTSRDTARQLADAGYKMLIKHDFRGALNAFDNSEQAYHGYRDSYEVYYLLWKNKQLLDDPEKQEELIQIIMKKYDTYGLLKKYYKPRKTNS